MQLKLLGAVWIFCITLYFRQFFDAVAEKTLLKLGGNILFIGLLKLGLGLGFRV